MSTVAHATAYVDQVFETVKKRSAGEPEFLQAVTEVFRSVAPALDRHPEYLQARILDRLQKISQPFGTKIAVSNGIGTIMIDNK